MFSKSAFGLILMMLAAGPAFATPAAAPYDGYELLEVYDYYVPVVPSGRAPYADFVNEQRRSLKSLGYVPWQWGASKCPDCALQIVPVNMLIETPEVYAFIKALEDRKFELLQLYGSSSQEYNLLAHMAVGILGRESKFFRSTRYQLKELAPGVVSAAKVVNAYLEYYGRVIDRSWNWDELSDEEKARYDKDRPRFTQSSRGPTQIKTLPEKIVEKYGITSDNLYVPENAAVTTMGYLIEALAELKRRVVKDRLSYIRPRNYVDYLPYIYFGSRAQLQIDPENPRAPFAEPWRNIYIKDMKAYMKWVELYEAPPRNALQP